MMMMMMMMMIIIIIIIIIIISFQENAFGQQRQHNICCRAKYPITRIVPMFID